ncbi:hypothetical protein [Deinococcus sp. Marseille-Q6407]|uniref:hypothetical protein n=1 Tax=Deinococcus sp. Marseille-Q6407 TaxID=2969223 RepID=UPI0021C07A72|nr:hypothetical protein [Deinococcus sp. Marseille-Q6407]
MTQLTSLHPHELCGYFVAQQGFYGLAQPQKRAAAILSHFSAAEQAELAGEFLVLREGRDIVAGLGVSEGKYVQGFYARAAGPQVAGQWQSLLQALRAQRPGPLRVYLEAHPQWIRPDLVTALEDAGFTRRTSYGLSKNLFGQPRHAELGRLTSWDDSTEAVFRATYEQLAGPLDFGWDTVKEVAVGSEFTPTLWYVQPGHTVFGIGSSGRHENRHLYRLCAAHSDQLCRAEVIALAETALIDHDEASVLHLYAPEGEVAGLQAQGYVVGRAEIHYDALP